MASKRKHSDGNGKMQEMHTIIKKHTLDSDEEDSDDYEKDDVSDVEGEEDGISNIQDEVKITPFNMREELQEGHFDKEGHFHWNKETEIKDSWLDNIDWVKVKTEKTYLNSEDSNESGTLPPAFNEMKVYQQLMSYMCDNEKVNETLRRLGRGRKKLSSVERIKQRKSCTDEAAEKITQFTELANEILTRTGNMDIYQMSYRQIQAKIIDMPSSSKQEVYNSSFDMYSEDFSRKEKQKLEDSKRNSGDVEKQSKIAERLLWEFKWKQDDTVLHGPYDTKQMLQWSQDGYFKKGVYVRKIGNSANFYNSKRIDFDVYL
ncbi:CD2 antigen cytoplasmic tail-binding protein 2 homolog [Glossina fuscipes]|uniref:CD2 antigen cytoplasmic tail-binding protein 2 homolog n=1 Tax=Glossina fuscipes TaxID=7396 RepID=A0A9C5Z796_9MUSC|nr:CD2 antigen cytoplasmic tail-binding protein 2 homolog [Glossina fuscipes]KAI9578828.1 hypothetical protein GQX74_009402 [Glossina fuscipes]